MTKIVSEAAVKLSQVFLKTEYESIIDNLTLLEDSVLTYDTNRNPNLSNAVQAAEDRQFSHHSGFDLRAMGRALYVYLTRQELQGASTIEQQLVRVIRGRFEISIGRKVSEILLATALGATFGKNTVMEMYMEVAYFGWQGNGIRQICSRLGLEPNMLNLDDACLVASLIKAPMPRDQSDRYKNRLNRRIKHVLSHLNRSGRELGA